MPDADPQSTFDIWPIALRSTHLADVGWTLWGTAPTGEGDWFLTRLDRVLLFASPGALENFVAFGPADHCFAAIPGWRSLAQGHLGEDVHEADFDEHGLWLHDCPVDWDSSRRGDVMNLLNLLWDAAVQFDDKPREADLLGGGRGSVLGRLADALMEGDDPLLATLAPSDVQSSYREHTSRFFARCTWVSD